MEGYFCPRCENNDVVTLGPILYCPECDLQLLIFNFDTTIEEVNRLNEINESSGFGLSLLDEKLSILDNLFRYKESTEICENLFDTLASCQNQQVVSIISEHILNILLNDDVPDDIVCRLEILKAKLFMFVAEMGYKKKLGNDELNEAAKLFSNYPEMDEDTLRCLDLLLKRDGDIKELLDLMAQIYFDRHNYELSLNYYNQSRNINNNDFWLWSHTSQIYLALDDFDRALECAAIAINTNDVDFKYVPELFRILGLKYNSDSVEYLNELYQSYSNKISNVDKIFAYADSLFDNGDYYGAIKEYDKCISLVDWFDDIWFNKGLAHYHLQQHEEVIYCMEKSLELNERMSTAWAMKATSLFSTGKFRDARYCAKNALNYDKNDLTAKGILDYFKNNPLTFLGSDFE